MTRCLTIERQGVLLSNMTQSSTPKADSLTIKWFEHAQTYAVVFASGCVVEGNLPTPTVAGERLAFHRERVAGIETWDNEHRASR